MVRVQEPATFPKGLLIGSDLADTAAARREIELWAARNGYRLPQDARHLAVIENGARVREWVLAEPDTPQPRPRTLPGPSLFRRPLAVVTRLRKAA